MHLSKLLTYATHDGHTRLCCIVMLHCVFAHTQAVSVPAVLKEDQHMGILMFSVSLMLNMCFKMSQSRHAASPEATTAAFSRVCSDDNFSRTRSAEECKLAVTEDERDERDEIAGHAQSDRKVSSLAADGVEGGGLAESLKRRQRHRKSSSRSRDVKKVVQDAVDAIIVPKQEHMQRQLDAISALVSQLASTVENMPREIDNISWMLQQDRQRLEVSATSPHALPTYSKPGFHRHPSSRRSLSPPEENEKTTMLGSIARVGSTKSTKVDPRPEPHATQCVDSTEVQIGSTAMNVVRGLEKSVGTRIVDKGATEGRERHGREVAVTWCRIGATAPAEGRLLRNPRLAKALSFKTAFTTEEYAAFGIAELSPSDYTWSADSFFQAALVSTSDDWEERLSALPVRERASGESSVDAGGRSRNSARGDARDPPKSGTRRRSEDLLYLRGQSFHEDATKHQQPDSIRRLSSARNRARPRRSNPVEQADSSNYVFSRATSTEILSTNTDAPDAQSFVPVQRRRSALLPLDSSPGTTLNTSWSPTISPSNDINVVLTASSDEVHAIPAQQAGRPSHDSTDFFRTSSFSTTRVINALAARGDVRRASSFSTTQAVRGRALQI